MDILNVKPRPHLGTAVAVKIKTTKSRLLSATAGCKPGQGQQAECGCCRLRYDFGFSNVIDNVLAEE
jgi:hypothetical protein